MQRKIRGYTVTEESVLSVLRSVADVPHDGTFFTAYFDSERNAFVVLVEHDSFEIVPEGCRFPIDVDERHRVYTP